MVFLMITFFAGIGIFSIIKDEVFSFIRTETVETLVEYKNQDLYDYLADMSMQIKGKSLNEEIFNDCITNMEETVRFSTKHSFADNQFWEILPPQIQNKIVERVLKSQVKLLQYFFKDKILNVDAPQSFVTSVMVNLESSLYDVGDCIVKYQEPCKDLIFIQSGCVELSGVTKAKVLNLNQNIYQKSRSGGVLYSKEEEPFSIRVVKLREGSWYGDFHILTSLKSSWEIRALKGGKDASNQPTGKVQVFELEALKFLEIVNHYPEFRRFILLRSSLRRMHWLKVFDENCHQWLLNRKIEDQKTINKSFGYENRNILFNYEEEDSVEEMLQVESNMAQITPQAKFGEISDRKDTMMMR